MSVTTLRKGVCGQLKPAGASPSLKEIIRMGSGGYYNRPSRIGARKTLVAVSSRHTL